jgi:outer membrane protein OmpA-like peptidoglycan-associated protein
LKYVFIFLTILFLNENVLPQGIPAPQTSEKKIEPAKTLSDVIKLTWLDLAFTNFFPFPGTRFADFSDLNIGGEVRLNFMVFNIKPLWISTNFMMDFNKTNSIRLDKITDMAVSIGAGWRFPFFNINRMYFTPRLAYGWMLHVTYGDYYNDPQIYPNDFRAGKKADRLFSDTYLHYEAEIAYDISPESRHIESEIFFSPSFIHFIEKVRQGLEIGYLIGIRAKMDTLFSSRPKVQEPKNEVLRIPPAILAGKVIDAETGAVFPDTLPTFSEGKGKKTDLLEGETFAFLVDPGKRIILKAEREGYESGEQKVAGEILVPNKREIFFIPLRPIKIWGFSGNVFELNTRDPIHNVSVYIVGFSEDDMPKEKIPTPVEEMVAKGEKTLTDKTGQYRMQIKKDTYYDIILKKSGYFTVRADFTTKGKKPGWYDITSYMNTPIQKTMVGAVMQFGNILFDTGSWIIRKDSIPVLDKMVQFLFDNPKIIVELGAHTDSMGPANENLVLSDNRAKSAVTYLISKGVPASHITAKGYGETKLTNRCSDGVPCTAAEHQANRRTELMAKEILPD